MSDGTEASPPLSSREKECLFHLAQGMTTARLAEALGISEKTAEKHITSARKKIGAKTREHAVAIAIRHNLF
ncbi:DNA-binding CsgD family transcriptional regulator [Azospirillum fermentarium]|uniref:response regulator transcription factor n=1 Tax=Azospirillum fermentarium TaxID=1233114 RepID=UPI0022269B86|nr:helix-turn-helix transcriptional regulator [Azospirillum fermentarium]MCW2248244.1 DNA-binding CsgD family transcriptional regulator [Azospirillum fermentarium]